jgi:glycosyltransferase involved in cell wall biosynthesis
VSEESGIDVHWVSVPYDNRMSYGQRIRSFLEFAWRAARRAASKQADVVFATSTPLTIAIPAVYAARRLDCPMVFEVRDLWPEVPIAIGALRNPVSKWLAYALQRIAYRSSARIVALAPGMADAVARTGYPRERITVIPNGCDSVDAADDGMAAQLREDTWLGERPLVVFTGTLGLVNGMSYLPRLAAAVRAIDPDIRFVVVGDGREYGATVELAKALGVLDANLRFLGRQPRSVASAWNRAADVTLALFDGPEIVWRDAVQNKFFESLAAGTPVASNFRGFQSIVAEEAGAGIVLSRTDIGSAARSLVSLLRDSTALGRASEAARLLARTRFNRDDLARQLESVLVSVLSDARR